MSDASSKGPVQVQTGVLADAERKVSMLGSGFLENAVLVIGWILAGIGCLAGFIVIFTVLYKDPAGDGAWLQYAIGAGCIAGGFLVALPYFIASQALGYLRSIAIVQVLTVD